MARATSIVSPRGLRKPVSFVIERAFPDAAPTSPEPRDAPATPRVRDSLVLRVVAKKKSGSRSPSNERKAR